MRELKRILVANRGEIACRILRTVHAMGLESVAMMSEAEAGFPHVMLADHAVFVGKAPPSESYLDVERVLRAARLGRADAIHPGYGFLSESADFAEACEAEGLVFVGPPPSAMRAMGSKAGARALMAEAGVPPVPGYHGEDQSDAALRGAADDIGLPVLIKASAGGGGRGMRIVRTPGELAGALASARREAAAAFGDDRLLLERYLEHARHIEVQVFGDSHGNLVHLFERDCSIQRRHQKIIEEAPAPDLPDALRARLHKAALDAAAAVGYVNAGTVEFIVAGDEAFFIEMNTRLQVEHPVTEAITGLDLVEWQIRIARGEPLPLAQDEIGRTGHAVEARLYAEDPQRGFLPQSGKLRHVHLGTWHHDVRVDTWLPQPGERNDPRFRRLEMPPWYDALLAKVIAHAADREDALGRLEDALRDIHIDGVATNRHLLAAVLEHEDVERGPVDTAWLEHHIDDLVTEPGPPANVTLALGVSQWLRDRQRRERNVPVDDPWDDTGGWWLNRRPSRRIDVDDGHGMRTVVLAPREPRPAAVWGDDLDVAIDGVGGALRIRFDEENGMLFAALGGEHVRGGVALDGARIAAMTEDEDAVLTLVDPRAAPPTAASGGGHLMAPMPGTVAAVSVAAGDAVAAGQTLVVVEAMKMEHAVTAPHDGTVMRVDCRAGDPVREGQELVVLEAT